MYQRLLLHTFVFILATGLLIVSGAVIVKTIILPDMVKAAAPSTYIENWQASEMMWLKSGLGTCTYYGRDGTPYTAPCTAVNYGYPAQGTTYQQLGSHASHADQFLVTKWQVIGTVTP